MKSYEFTSEASGSSGSLSAPGSSLVGTYHTSTNLIGNQKKTTAIVGYVRDADGLPISGVTVRLFDELDQVILETTTDEQGFYYFIGIEAGTYRIFPKPKELSLFLPSSHILDIHHHIQSRLIHYCIPF